MMQMKKPDKLSMTKIKEAIKKWIFLMVIVGITLSALLLYVMLSFEQINTIDKVEFVSTKEHHTVSADTEAADDTQPEVLCGEDGYNVPAFLMNNVDTQKNLKDKDMKSTEAASLAIEAAEKLYDIKLSGATVDSELYDGYYNDELVTVWFIAIYPKSDDYFIFATLNSVTGELVSIDKYSDEEFDEASAPEMELRQYYDNVNKYYDETMNVVTSWLDKKSDIEGIWYCYLDISKALLGEMLQNGGKMSSGIYNYYYVVTTKSGKDYIFQFDSFNGFIGFEIDSGMAKWYMDDETEQLYPESGGNTQSKSSYKENVEFEEYDSSYSWSNNVIEETEADEAK